MAVNVREYEVPFVLRGCKLRPDSDAKTERCRDSER